MAIRQQRAEHTRERILREFRASFLGEGFESTAIDTVLERLKLSKGALYHHFSSKTDIMHAIYEEVSRDAIAQALEGAANDGPTLQRLKLACLAWLERVRSPDVAAILFDIGPSALGYVRAKGIEESNSLVHFKTLLDEAQSNGEIVIDNIALSAKMLSALVAEAALHAVHTKEDVSNALGHAIDGLVRGLDLRNS